MKVQVNSTFEVNEYLNGVIEEKVSKLANYSDRITEAEVYHSDAFEKAVAGAADKVKRQLLKYKEQVTNHH